VSGRVLTDDQGAYRQRLLGSGDYYVRAVLESSPVPITVYYPETLENSKAAPVILSEGSEIAADIRIDSSLTAKTFQISGSVVLPPLDVASPFIELVLTTPDPNGPIETSPTTDLRGSTRANEGIGKFEFRGVGPGNYELRANTRINGRSYSGSVLIDVRDGDIDRGVELRLRVDRETHDDRDRREPEELPPALEAERAAVAEFDEVVQKYGQDQKVAGAMLRQGHAFAELKDTRNARFFLQQVQKKYPNSPEAQQAAEKLKQLR
jgi:hypothetical protein